MARDTHLYVLELSDGRLYVGTTSDPEFRLEAHAAGEGALWTRRFTPLRLASLQRVPSRADPRVEETRRTAELMLAYGVNRVRGGPWTQREDFGPVHVDMLVTSIHHHLAVGADINRVRVLVETDLGPAMRGERAARGEAASAPPPDVRRAGREPELDRLQRAFGAVTQVAAREAESAGNEAPRERRTCRDCVESHRDSDGERPLCSRHYQRWIDSGRLHRCAKCKHHKSDDDPAKPLCRRCWTVGG